jgi:hypothetical protein
MRGASLPVCRSRPIDQTDETCTRPIRGSTPIGCAKRLAVTGQIAAGGGQAGLTGGMSAISRGPMSRSIPLKRLTGLRGGNPIKVVVFTEVVYDDIGFLDALGLGPIPVATSHEERHYGIR